jgi:hypothetical protein
MRANNKYPSMRFSRHPCQGIKQIDQEGVIVAGRLYARFRQGQHAVRAMAMITIVTAPCRGSAQPSLAPLSVHPP